MAIIRNYGYSAKLNFLGNINKTAWRGYIGPEVEFDGVVFQGDEYWQECECNCPHCYDNGETVYTDPEVRPEDFADAIADVFNDHSERYLVFKEDSSVQGVELNIQPMTYEYMYAMKDTFSEMFDLVQRRNVNGRYESHSAGMHVHMSYTMFQSDDHVKKFVQLFELLFEDVFEFSRRRYTSYCGSCNINPMLEPPDFKKEYYNNNRDRVKMQIVNTMHDNTLEVRIFTAPDDVDMYFANIQLCLVFLQLSRSRRVHKITWDSVKQTAKILGFEELTKNL